MKNRLLSMLLAATLLLVPTTMPSFAKTGSMTSTKTTKTATIGKTIDINTASSSELCSVKGIGKKTAAKIIAGRPYKGKNDLMTRKIVDKGQYAMIKDSIIAKQGGMSKMSTTKTKTVSKTKM